MESDTQFLDRSDSTCSPSRVLSVLTFFRMPPSPLMSIHSSVLIEDGSAGIKATSSLPGSRRCRCREALRAVNMSAHANMSKVKPERIEISFGSPPAFQWVLVSSRRARSRKGTYRVFNPC